MSNRARIACHRVTGPATLAAVLVALPLAAQQPGPVTSGVARVQLSATMLPAAHLEGSSRMVAPERVGAGRDRCPRRAPECTLSSRRVSDGRGDAGGGSGLEAGLGGRGRQHPWRWHPSRSAVWLPGGDPEPPGEPTDGAGQRARPSWRRRRGGRVPLGTPASLRDPGRADAMSVAWRR